MEILGYVASLLIGLSLGLIGGGGSILTVPVMVYLFQVSPVVAVSYSLFIVGTTSLVGAYNNFRKGMINFRAAFFFGLTSIITVFITRKFLVPAIPSPVFYIGSQPITSSLLTMVLFAILMLLASYSMIRKAQPVVRSEKKDPYRFAKLIFYGVGIGMVTGLLGAGGGFLLIPTLVFFVKLPMKKAIGTSLLIIAMNSMVGFIGDLGRVKFEWRLIIPVALIAILGIFLGGRLARRIPGPQLKKVFGWFVLIMGVAILSREVAGLF